MILGEQSNGHPSPHWRGAGERSKEATRLQSTITSHPNGNTGLIRIQKINDAKLKTAKYLRQHMTFGEQCFWNLVRNNKLDGLRFRRQQVIHGFIADFYCNQIALVVEIDGGIHELQKDYDELRGYIIKAHGIKVIRFTNDDVVNNSSMV